MRYCEPATHRLAATRRLCGAERGETLRLRAGRRMSLRHPLRKASASRLNEIADWSNVSPRLCSAKPPRRG